MEMEAEMEKMRATPPLMQSFKVAKIFTDNQAPLSSLCFDDSGELCVTSAEDESLHVYDCKEGKLKATLFSKKYGVNLARFTHSKNNVVYASTKEDDTLRYLSLHDNKYIRYFRGHKKRVLALEMSPLGDQFLSASLDETARLWDLRSAACQGMIHIKGRPTVAVDPAGLVFAVGLGSKEIKMYDLRAYDSGPFSTWTVEDSYTPMGLPEWTNLRFSNDGKHIMISTVSNMNYLIDAYNGSLKQRLVGHAGPGMSTSGEEIGMSPDGRFAFAGGGDGNLRVWDIQPPNLGNAPFDNMPIVTLPTPHQTRGVRICGFSPSLLMLATGTDELAFWEPKFPANSS
ncbi:member of Set1p complex, histone methyl transferase [Apophysomyces sp. BC1015]|nr:member of Set1p complex, histone methyl transferase [Apophysomyces sp. BC1015]KAG0179029.1 member of Set1p complex, histone methyl transferase [Apophysomyces sp. BC1021]